MSPPSGARLKSDYAAEVSKTLQRPKKKNGYAVLDLYAGAGGLSLGLEAAGFKVAGIDQDADCCDTYNSNLEGRCSNYALTPKSDFPEAPMVKIPARSATATVVGFKSVPAPARICL